MKKTLLPAIVALALLLPAAALADEPAGQKIFLAAKCNMCHAVPAADIEATTASEKMKGPELGGKIEVEFEKIAAFVRKEADLDGASHKKPFKGTDEELQAIIDWLGSLEAPK